MIIIKTPLWDCGIVKVDGFGALVALNENEKSKARKAFELPEQSARWLETLKAGEEHRMVAPSGNQFKVSARKESFVGAVGDIIATLKRNSENRIAGDLGKPLQWAVESHCVSSSYVAARVASIFILSSALMLCQERAAHISQSTPFAFVSEFKCQCFRASSSSIPVHFSSRTKRNCA